MARRLILVIIFLFVGALPVFAATYYIDYAGGSNVNDGLAKTVGGGHGPWKSHPYMQIGSGCTGGVTGWGGYSHQAGDQFIFKGGVGDVPL